MTLIELSRRLTGAMGFTVSDNNSKVYAEIFYSTKPKKVIEKLMKRKNNRAFYLIY
jgi:hypothetical protein